MIQHFAAWPEPVREPSAERHLATWRAASRENQNLSDKVSAEFRHAPATPDVPLIVLTAMGHDATQSHLWPAELLREINEVKRGPHAEVAAESPRGDMRVLASGEPRVIMLTTFDSFDLDQLVYDAPAVGASGFLLKDVTPEHLVAAVRLIRTGDALLAPAIARRIVECFAGSGHRDRAGGDHRNLPGGAYPDGGNRRHNRLFGGRSSLGRGCCAGVPDPPGGGGVHRNTETREPADRRRRAGGNGRPLVLDHRVSVSAYEQVTPAETCNP
ncbi:hypothetical protein [Streptomyces sp. NPDC054834]